MSARVRPRDAADARPGSGAHPRGRLSSVASVAFAGAETEASTLPSPCAASNRSWPSVWTASSASPRSSPRRTIAEELFRTIVDETKRALRVDYVTIRLLRDDRLHLAAWAGIDDDVAAALPVLGIRRRLGRRRSLRTGQTDGVDRRPDRPCTRASSATRHRRVRGRPRRAADPSRAGHRGAVGVHARAARLDRRRRRIHHHARDARRRSPSRTPSCSSRPRRRPASSRSSRRRRAGSAGRPRSRPSAARSSRRRGGSSTTTTRGCTCSSRPTRSSRSRSRAASARTTRSTSTCCAAGSARASPAGSRSTASRCSSTMRTAIRGARPSPAPTTSTNRCSSCRCATTRSTVGVITLSKLGLDGFDADDLRLLTILADHAATALETARLLTRSQDLARELRRLLDMSGELSESLDPRQVANLMAGHLARAMGVDECAISYWDRPSGPARVARLLPGRFDSRRWSRSSRSPATPRPSRVLERGVTVIIDADDPTADPAEVALLRRDGIRMLVMLPLVAKGQAIGLVELFSRTLVQLGRPAARGRADDGQRGGDGPRERAPLRGRPQARGPRPADRLLQPPLPARADGRGGRPRAAQQAAAERADARPRRLQARQRHVRAPLRRPRPDLGRRADPGDAAGLRRPGPLRRRRVRRDPARDRRRRGDARRRADPRRVPRASRSSASSAGRCPIAASIGTATFPADGRTATELIARADRALYQVKRDGRARSARARPGRKYQPAPSHRYQGRWWTAAPRGRILYSRREPIHPAHRRATMDPSDRRIRRSWWIFSGAFLLLAAIVLLQALSRPTRRSPIAPSSSWSSVAGVAAVVHGAAVADLETRRRGEAESFARILSGLSRSVSPDAIVDAIAEELGRRDRRRPRRRGPARRDRPLACPPTSSASARASRPTRPRCRSATSTTTIRGRPATAGGDRRADRAPRPGRLRPRPGDGRATGRRRGGRRGDRRVAPGRGDLAGVDATDPQRCRGRGIGGAGAGRLASRCRGTRVDRCADRAPEPALLRRIRRAARAWPAGGRRRRDPDDRHRPVQGAQRHVRPRDRRCGPAQRGGGDRLGGPRGRRPGPVRWGGVRRAAARIPHPGWRSRSASGSARRCVASTCAGSVCRRSACRSASRSRMARKTRSRTCSQIADQNLYSAKRAGRDRVVAA